MPVIPMAGYRQRQGASRQPTPAATALRQQAGAPDLIAFAKLGQIGGYMHADAPAISERQTKDFHCLRVFLPK